MKLVIVGDTVLAQAPREAKTGGAPAMALLRGADLVLANLEAPLSDRPWPAEKEMTIRVATSTATELRALGIDVVSLATNHALDHGVDGLRSTIAALDGVGIRHAGAGETLAGATTGTVVAAEDGTRVAVLSFCSTLPPGANATTTRPGVAPLRVDQSLALDGALLEEQPGTPPVLRTTAREADVVHAEECIRRAACTADRVVVCLHWGVAFSYMPPNQGPLAQYQQPLGRRLIDAGADLVAGTHPHCLHPIEAWNNGLILYSTGNFLFHSGEVLKPEGYKPVGYRAASLFETTPWRDSAVFEIDLEHGRPPELRITPIELDERGEPHPAPAASAARIRSHLEAGTREVHPDARINTDGSVRFGR